jgi:holin-like protein LrgB
LLSGWAKPRAIGFEILNHLTILVPNAEITTAFRITANDVNSLTPPILGTSGHTLGVAAAKELGETEESMGSIAVVIVGVISIN